MRRNVERLLFRFAVPIVNVDLGLSSSSKGVCSR